MTRLPAPSPRAVLRGAAIGAPLLLLAVLLIRGSRTADIPNLRAPKDIATSSEPPTTPAPDLTGVGLPGIDGTTVTTRPRAVGTAHIVGTVRGPQGPVAGATVRAERLDGAPPVDATAGPDGRYDVANIAGGRYRVRAFLPPAFAQTKPEIFFLPDGEQHPLDLNVDQFGGLEISNSFAPDPPVVGQQLSVVIRLANRAVDGDGIVQAAPVPGGTVTLTSIAGFTADSPSSTTTDVNGDATFTLTCRSAGAAQVLANVQPSPTQPPAQTTVSVTACVSPTPTTGSQSSSSGSSSSSNRSSGPSTTN